MPVTIKLSQQFYDKLGDEVTNELVNVLNTVDSSYRTELKEINELNFTRFDGRLNQRMAKLENRMSQRMNELENRVNQRISEVEAKLTMQMTDLESRMTQRMSRLELSVSQFEVSITKQLAQYQDRMFRWMLIVWAPTAIATAGLVFGVIGLYFRS